MNKPSDALLTEQYKKALLLVRDKKYVSISLLILGMKPLGYELSYDDASILVSRMCKDKVVKCGVIDIRQINQKINQ